LSGRAIQSIDRIIYISRLLRLIELNLLGTGWSWLLILQSRLRSLLLLKAKSFRASHVACVIRDALRAIRSDRGLPIKPEHLFLEPLAPLSIELVFRPLHPQALKILILELSSCLEERLLDDEMKVQKLVLVVVSKQLLMQVLHCSI
jgi:hypothetical protein